MDLLGLTRGELSEAVLSLGEPRFRADQLLNWLYRRLVTDFDLMTNLPAGFRERLKAAGWRAQAATVAASRRAEDGTERFLFVLGDGQTVEGVYLPEERRRTVCLSSQVGCGIKCAFCATGRSGLIRNLTPGEMVDTVRQIEKAAGKRISHVVVMGQGEPLANYDAVMRALEIINAQYALGIAARRITISTCGIAPRILDLAETRFQYNLAVSLHAVHDELRDRLVPVNRLYPLEVLREACLAYTRRSGRRITLEYVMLREVNDRPADLAGLIRFAGGWLTHVNLIPFHVVPDVPFEPSTPETIRLFLKALQNAGIPATLRKSRGLEVQAACGQLRQELTGSGEARK